MGPDGLALSIGHATSGAEEIARAVPGARLVKAFNTTGFGVMEDAFRFAPRPVMFAASDDAEARAVALRLAGDIGFDPVDAGPLAAARLLEAHAMLWIELATKRGLGRDIAFALLRAEPVTP
jgi:predicted dinucleotide-binding enzyme